LIQSQLGSVSIGDGKSNTMGLSSETYHIFKVTLRVSNCNHSCQISLSVRMVVKCETRKWGLITGVKTYM